MEYNYPSLYSNIFILNDENDSGTEIIRSINGHVDNHALFKYYDLDHYATISKSHNTPIINLLHVNVRSTRKNFDNLKILINSFSSEPDIIAVTETWLSDNALFLYELEGYRS